MKIESTLRKWLNNQLSIASGMDVSNVDLGLIKMLLNDLLYDNAEELIYNQIRRQTKMTNDQCRNITKGFINYHKSLIRDQKLKHLLEFNSFRSN
jgi:hypothetical protein